MSPQNNIDSLDTRAPSLHADRDPGLPARLRVARWLGHQRWIPRGHTSLVRLLCSPEAAPDFDFNVDFYGLRYVGNLRDVLDWSVFFFGAHAKSELEMMSFAAECLRSAGRPVVYVDVGANVGQHLLFMSMHADVACGFEPWDPVLQRARKLLALNRVDNVSLFQIALGDANESRRFYPPSTANHGSGSFVKDWFNLNDVEGALLFLEVRKGDEVLASSNIRNLGILKIDVEGSEASVLRGLRDTIRRDRPFVLMEVSGHTAREFGSEDGFRSCLYDGALVYRLGGGRHRVELKRYCFDDSLSNETADLAEVVIVPAEHRESFVSRLRTRVFSTRPRQALPSSWLTP
jgi:FkbM family methyltransferase